MIKNYLIISFFLLNLQGFSRDLVNFNSFLTILSKLESSDNDGAIGDNGKSISRYQIQKACYLDAKEYDKSIDFNYESLTNKLNAARVVKAYISRYSKTNNFEEWARLWNSGPNWRNKKELTNKYWLKFQQISKKI